MNYDQEHERVEAELSQQLTASQLREQRLQKIIAMRKDGKTLREISDEVGVTRQRVEQLLKPTGIEVPSKARRQKRRQAVAEWVKANPLMSCQEGSKVLGCSAHTISKDLKALGIERDVFVIRSASIVQAKLDGRAELTEELLRKEYIHNNLSTNEIARKYGYRQSGVMRRLGVYNIHKDKSVVCRQISEKRLGTKLIDGRFV